MTQSTLARAIGSALQRANTIQFSRDPIFNRNLSRVVMWLDAMASGTKDFDPALGEFDISPSLRFKDVSFNFSTRTVTWFHSTRATEEEAQTFADAFRKGCRVMGLNRSIRELVVTTGGNGISYSFNL